MPLTSINTFSLNNQYSYLPSNNKTDKPIFTGVSRPQSTTVKPIRKQPTSSKSVFRGVEQPKSEFVITTPTEPLTQTKYESRRQKRLERAENIERFYTRTTEDLGLKADPRTRLSELGGKRFVVENIKAAARIPAEIPGQLARIGANIKNVADAAITNIPTTRSGFVEQAVFAPKVYQVAKTEVLDVKRGLTKVGRKAKEIVVSGVRPPSQSTIVSGLVTLKLDDKRRREALSVVPEESDFFLDPRTVGGTINIVAAVSGVGLFRRGIKSASYKAASNRLDAAIKEIGAGVTQKGQVWSSEYVIPSTTKPIDLTRLFSERVGPIEKQRIVKRIGAEKIEFAYEPLEAGQTQIVPKTIKPSVLPASQQAPLEISKYDPSKQTKLAERISIQDSYKKTVIRESPQYDIKFKSDMLLAKPKQPTPAKKRVSQEVLIEEIEAIDPYRKIVVQESQYGDLTDLSKEFGRSKNLFKKGLLGSKRATFRGSSPILDQPKLSQKPIRLVDDDVWGKSVPKPLIDKPISDIVPRKMSIRLPKFAPSAALLTKQKRGGIQKQRSELQLINDVIPDTKYIPRQPQKPDIIQKSITKQVPDVIIPFIPKQKYVVEEEPIIPEKPFSPGTIVVSPPPAPKKRRKLKFQLPDDFIPKTRKRLTSVKPFDISRYSPSVVGVLRKQKRIQDQVLSGLEVRGI